MNTKQKYVLSSFVRVREFLGSRSTAGPPELPARLEELEGVVATLLAHATEQEVGQRLSQAASQRNWTLRRELVDGHMRPIAQLARALFGWVAGADGALRMPRVKRDSVALIAASRAMAEAALASERAFISYGRPERFIKELLEVADALENSLDGSTRETRRRVGATAALGAEVKKGRALVRLLDAMITPWLVDDPRLLAQWRSARRVRAVPIGGAVGALEIPPATAAIQEERAA